jgi:hypothetical protein
MFVIDLVVHELSMTFDVMCHGYRKVRIDRIELLDYSSLDA